MEKAQEAENKRLEQEKEMKAKAEKEMKANAEKEMKANAETVPNENLKGGNPNKQHIKNILDELYNKCQRTAKWGKEDWGNKGPPISDSILNDIVYYCLLEELLQQ